MHASTLDRARIAMAEAGIPPTTPVYFDRHGEHQALVVGDLFWIEEHTDQPGGHSHFYVWRCEPEAPVAIPGPCWTLTSALATACALVVARKIHDRLAQ